MILDEKKAQFIISILRCFFILVFFGIFLPKFIDFILYNFVIKPHSYDNSIFVYSIFTKNMDIVYNYTIVFNEFLKF